MEIAFEFLPVVQSWLLEGWGWFLSEWNWLFIGLSLSLFIITYLTAGRLFVKLIGGVSYKHYFPQILAGEGIVALLAALTVGILGFDRISNLALMISETCLVFAVLVSFLTLVITFIIGSMVRQEENDDKPADHPRYAPY